MREEVYRDEGEPDDARRIHGEGYVLGLVEVRRDVPRLEGVDGTEGDEDHIVEQRQRHSKVRTLALKYDRPTVRVD